MIHLVAECEALTITNEVCYYNREKMTGGEIGKWQVEKEGEIPVHSRLYHGKY